MLYPELNYRLLILGYLYLHIYITRSRMSRYVRIIVVQVEFEALVFPVFKYDAKRYIK